MNWNNGITQIKLPQWYEKMLEKKQEKNKNEHLATLNYTNSYPKVKSKTKNLNLQSRLWRCEIEELSEAELETASPVEVTNTKIFQMVVKWQWQWRVVQGVAN